MDRMRKSQVLPRIPGLAPTYRGPFTLPRGGEIPHATRLLVLKTSIVLIDLPGSTHNRLIAWAQTVMLGFSANRDQCHDLP